MHGTTETDKPLIAENKAKAKNLGDDYKSSKSDHMIRWVTHRVVPNVSPGLCLENGKESL
jgi:hypothetical protein